MPKQTLGRHLLRLVRKTAVETAVEVALRRYRLQHFSVRDEEQ